MSGVGALCQAAAVFVNRRCEDASHLPSHPAGIAAAYVELAMATGATPKQVFDHLVGKLAVLDQGLLLGCSDLQQRLNSLDTCLDWSQLSAKSQPQALIEALKKLAHDVPEFIPFDFKQHQNDEHAKDGSDDDGGGWTLVWRDKRY